MQKKNILTKAFNLLILCSIINMILSFLFSFIITFHQNHSMSGTFRTTPFSDGISGYRYASYSPHLRRSMPNVNFHLHSNEPPKLYPYHLLATTNYRLPPDVDRCHLEVGIQSDPNTFSCILIAVFFITFFCLHHLIDSFNGIKNSCHNEYQQV